MSRVEDDRQAARIAEQRQIQKQQDEAKSRERVAQDSAFAKKMATTQGQQTLAQAKHASEKAGAASAYDALLDDMNAAEQAQGPKGGKDGLGRSVLREAASAFQDKLKQARAGEGERMGENKLAAADTGALIETGRKEDLREAHQSFEGRGTDMKSAKEETERGDKAAARSGAGGTARGEKELKTGADGGGGKNSGGGGDGKEGGNEMGAGFRFNPALMAPVPVAQPKDTAASERIRRVAQEIAQKIVESVRVGTNAAGQAEFQIELRSNVLAGLAIKVSGGNGKISATFSGSDREVLKQLEENKESLQKALSGRGLTLETLKIEATA